MDPLRRIAIEIAKSHLSRPYVWGGDDPRGFDCSGLVIEVLQSVGMFPLGRDATADVLFRTTSPVHAPDVLPGDLVFWLHEGRATHVGMLIDPPELYIGAEGGGAWATDPQAALRRNAYVKIRPVAGRGLPDARRFGNPFAG